MSKSRESSFESAVAAVWIKANGNGRTSGIKFRNYNKPENCVFHILILFTDLCMSGSVAHWLPFSASTGDSSVIKCDVDGYFIPNNEIATFRGRNLCGMRVDLAQDFTWYVLRTMNSSAFSILKSEDSAELSGDISKIDELSIWNHDDKPLRSDVVPQAINLARVQNYLGSNSGII